MATSYSSAPYGIYVFSTTTGVTVEKNKVSDISNSNTGGYGARGIHVNTGIAFSNITLKNNFVWRVKATADAGTTYWGIGIGIEGATSGVNAYYNMFKFKKDEIQIGKELAEANILKVYLILRRYIWINTECHLPFYETKLEIEIGTRF